MSAPSAFVVMEKRWLGGATRKHDKMTEKKEEAAKSLR